jgi:hypothetical protein
MLRRHSLGQKNLTASGEGGFLPGDTKVVKGVGFLAIGCRVRFAGYLDDQLFRLNLNARDPGSNEGKECHQTKSVRSIACTRLIVSTLLNAPLTPGTG